MTPSGLLSNANPKRIAHLPDMTCFAALADGKKQKPESLKRKPADETRRPGNRYYGKNDAPRPSRRAKRAIRPGKRRPNRLLLFYQPHTGVASMASPQRLSERSQSSACVPHSSQPQVVSVCNTNEKYTRNRMRMRQVASQNRSEDRKI